MGNETITSNENEKRKASELSDDSELEDDANFIVIFLKLDTRYLVENTVCFNWLIYIVNFYERILKIDLFY